MTTRSPARECRSCGATIHWVVTEFGNRTPIDPDGKSHFATCSSAAAHRAPRRQATKHHCHAKRCDVPVPPKMLMCRPHWQMVPRDIQQMVWDAYVPNQEVTKTPTREYLAVAKLAIDAVDRAERERMQHGAQTLLALLEPNRKVG